MKRTVWTRVLAVLLVVCMMAPSVSAAGWGSWGSNASTNGWGDWFRGIWDQIIGTIGGEEEEPVVEEEQELVLIEDASTVENGDMLRASTYALTTTAADGTTTESNVVYYPVTLYNYTDTVINAATAADEVENYSATDAWYGMYFNGGAQSNVTYNGISRYYGPASIWTNKIFDGDTTYYQSRYSNTTYNMNSYGKLALYNTNPNLQVSATYVANGNSRTSASSVAGYVYTGLVKNTLDANKDIQFTVADGGLFNDDATVKDIYTKVGLPFQFDGATYTFDSASESAAFAGDPTSNVNLVSTKDGQFWPFGNSDPWHFGMNATIPFSMTSDGKLSSTDPTDIVFNFAGDDDVWVFIDGILVLDIGGIHNSASGSINFAQNTTSVFATDTSLNSGYMNMTDGHVAGRISGKLFNEYDENGNLTTQGVLNKTIETFAAEDSHELTVFYLERGQGVSNCKISFNLPMKDVVSVQKIIDGQAVVDTDGHMTTKDLNDLTTEQRAVLNNQDFGFTLYKDGSPVANATYNLLNANGQVIAHPSTDANGHFTLKNGQTAKFVGEFAASGNTYYVVEDIKDGFIYTQYTATVNATDTPKAENKACGTHQYYKLHTDQKHWVTNKDYSDGTLKSDAYTVNGSDEAEDSLVFVCKNYMNASLPKPSAIPADDKVVIDYDLSVVVDLFSNDLYLANNTSIVFRDNAVSNDVYTGQYGTFTYDSTTKKITYTLNKQLTGVEVIEYTLIGETDGTRAEGNAKVYIIPATTMYYEENFGLVTFTGTGWQEALVTEGTYTNATQEPGVVGTVGDSPYGSDAAYLYDSHDSNGTSKYASTENGAVKFSYTFTGTGSSFFARTTSNTGYMRIVVTDASGKTVQSTYRDTAYKSTDTKSTDTLYNIPVFTIDGLNYGAYTVTVTVAKQNKDLGYGGEFWLDGIRVFEPLSSEDANSSVATSAYATDGEANMTNVTLRNKLLGEADLDDEGNPFWSEGCNFVLFTDVNGKMTTAEEYKSIGPKEEVYLNKGQSVTFSLYDWDPNTNKVYLGIKAPFGSGVATVGSTTLTISNAADCYYDITSYGTVTTDEDGVKTVTFAIASTDNLISLTNIKVTGNAKFTIVSTGVNEDYPGSQN